MKMNKAMRINKNIPFIIISLFLSISINSFAHVFEVDGIYYNVLSDSDKTVYVTYQGDWSGSYSNEYTGRVTIPETVTYSGKTYSVTSIGERAFEACSGLTEVIIPNSVTSIARYVFSSCSSLTSVTIPNSVTSIGGGAFHWCSGLTEVNISDLSAWCNINFENYDSNPLYYANHLKMNGTEITNLIIPDGITEIKDCTFSNCISLTSVIIPNSVTEIGDYAFYGCSGLKSVTIGNSVTSIGIEAFYNCTKLNQVINLSKLSLTKGSTNHGYVAYYAHEVINAPNGIINGDFVWSISEEDDVNKLARYLGVAFELILPDDYNGENYVIGDDAFYACSSLTSVTIPNTVTSIGDSAFSGCSGLTELIILDGTETLSLGSSFTDCPIEQLYLGRNLNYYTGSYYGYSPFYNKTTLKEVTIGNSATSISISAFYGCRSLTSVTIPNSVASIGESAFYNCSGLTSVTIPNSITSIGNSTFYNCSGLTSITIPNSVTSIGDYAFYDCSGLASVTIGNSVTSIGNSAFYNCRGLTSITIPNSVTSIGGRAFSDCSGLTSVTIGNSVTSIGYKAFYNCRGLTSLTIGTGVLSIGTNAFSYYDNNNYSNLDIKKVIWLTNTPPEGYKNVGSEAHYVSNNLYSGLSNVTIYPYLSSLFEVDGIKYVPVSPSERTCDALDCSYETSISDINIGKTVSFKGIEMNIKAVKPYTFYDNTNITKATIDPEFNGSIGDYAFAYCNKIDEIILLDGVTSLGSSAFEGCLSLASVKIGSGISALNDNTFYGCTSLPAITIPANVTSIGNYVFDNCTSLANVTIEDSEIIEEDTQKQQSFPNWTSSNHNNNSTSSEEYNINVNPGDVLTFNYTVSSESNYDFLIVKLDGKEILKESGSKSGNYTTTFDSTKVVALYMEYTKDSSNSNGTDNASVTDIMINGSSAEGSLILGSNGSSPLFSDCPLNTVYIGRDISYSTSSGNGYSPFYRNTSLETVVITDKETEISENEFYGCTALKTVSMGDGVETIGNWAFSGCSSLDFFSFGSGMKTIGTEAFSDCTAMTKLYSKAIVPPTCGSQALDDINKWNCELYVPQASIADYQAADQWKEFFFIKDIESGVEEVLVDGEDYSNATIEIYNLSGLKVGDSTENLAPGVYIKRQGRKVEKIAIQ